MSITEWELWLLISRWLLYAATAAIIGGCFFVPFVSTQTAIKKHLVVYIFIGIGAGFTASILYFFIRVGMVLEESIAGIFDREIIAILWSSPVGDALILRLIALTGVLLAAIKLYQQALSTYPFDSRRPLKQAILSNGSIIVGLGLLLWSYTLAGHTATSSLVIKMTLAVHILLISWWIGSLYPLYVVSRQLTPKQSYIIMVRFGYWAAIAVALILIAGGYMSYQLTGWQQLTNNSYGLLLITKIGLVALILLLAAIHKWSKVPRLLTATTAQSLSYSILVELTLATLVLVTTAALTSLTGPGH